MKQSLSKIYLRALISLLLSLAATITGGYLLLADAAPSGELSRSFFTEYRTLCLLLAVPALVAPIVIGVVLYFRVTRAVGNDIKSIGRMFYDIRHGGLRADYPMELAEFAGIFHYLRDSGRKLVEEKKKLKGLGLIDHLSQLSNRRHFEKRLKELFELAKGHGPSSVLIIDMDHFKAVNDNYGHDAGDALIVAFAKTLRAAVRQTDFLARLGGDEFCVIYPYAPPAKAAEFAERLRKQLPRDTELPNGVRHPLKWTGGLSSMTTNDKKFDDVLWRADKALMLAKEGGRNATRVCPPEETHADKVRLQVLS